MTHFVHARRQARSPDIQLPCGIGDGGDDALITGLHRIERIGHLPDFILAGQRHAGAEVAAFFNVQHHVFQRVQLAEQEADQQLRSAKHGKHQDEHRHRVIGEALPEHLSEAGAISDDRDLLTVGAAENFGTEQQVVAEQWQVIDLVPAIAFGDLQQRLIVEARYFAAFKRQHLLGLGQRLPDRPGLEQLRLSLRRRLGRVTARLLFELNGI